MNLILSALSSALLVLAWDRLLRFEAKCQASRAWRDLGEDRYGHHLYWSPDPYLQALIFRGRSIGISGDDLERVLVWLTFLALALFTLVAAR